LGGGAVGHWRSILGAPDDKLKALAK